MTGKLKVASHALNPRIADVDAVQEGHHVNDEEDGVDDKIQLHHELALGLGVNWSVIGTDGASLFILGLQDLLGRLRRAGNGRVVLLGRPVLFHGGRHGE